MKEIKTPIKSIEPVETDELVKLSELAERRVEAVKKLIRAALKMTSAKDWVNIGGTPYLTSSGAEKIAKVFGVGWKDLEIKEEHREDEKGPWIMYTCTGTFYMKDRSICAIGTCCTRDELFGMVHGKVKSLTEIDLPSVKKSAYTNCIVNGIKMLLGLKNIDKEDLLKAGIDFKKVAEVKFKRFPPKEVEAPLSEQVQTPLTKAKE